MSQPIQIVPSQLDTTGQSLSNLASNFQSHLNYLDTVCKTNSWNTPTGVEFGAIHQNLNNSLSSLASLCQDLASQLPKAASEYITTDNSTL